jgi:hypothetical protein
MIGRDKHLLVLLLGLPPAPLCRPGGLAFDVGLREAARTG